MSGFDALMARLDAPMVIVTTATDRERAGCLVGFHSQSGIAPTSLAVWLSKANHTFRVATMADVFAVHFLARDDLELAQLFGTLSGDDVDKFQRCPWHPGLDGVPVLDGCGQHVVGRKSALLQTTADHVCLILDPVETIHGGSFEPLRLSDVRDLQPGHEPDERPAPATTRARHGGLLRSAGGADGPLHVTAEITGSATPLQDQRAWTVRRASTWWTQFRSPNPPSW